MHYTEFKKNPLLLPSLLSSSLSPPSLFPSPPPPSPLPPSPLPPSPLPPSPLPPSPLPPSPLPPSPLPPPPLPPSLLSSPSFTTLVGGSDDEAVVVCVFSVNEGAGLKHPCDCLQLKRPLGVACDQSVIACILPFSCIHSFVYYFIHPFFLFLFIF